MSIERFIADQNKNKPRQFKDVVGKLLSEKETVDLRPWKWEEEVTENDWEHMLNVQKRNHDEQDWAPYSLITAGIFQLDSSRMHAISESTWDKIKNDVNEKRKDRINRNLAKNISKNMGQIDPTRIETEPPQLEEIQNRMREGRETENYWMFIYAATTWKKLYPTQKIDIDEKIWDGIRKLLEQLRQNNQWEVFANIAASMRILAAHKIEMTSKGLVITDVPSLQLDAMLFSRPIRKKL